MEKKLLPPLALLSSAACECGLVFGPSVSVWAAEIEKQQQEQQQLTTVTTKTQNVHGEEIIVATT
ncbi:hypothetical protein QBC39DRAFT_377021 [Podospora conica]|nr:hypothetical protein QBC39DRAFT_377021 [Schizothecium conicum]